MRSARVLPASEGDRDYKRPGCSGREEKREGVREAIARNEMVDGRWLVFL